MDTFGQVQKGKLIIRMVCLVTIVEGPFRTSVESGAVEGIMIVAGYRVTVLLQERSSAISKIATNEN